MLCLEQEKAVGTTDLIFHFAQVLQVIHIQERGLALSRSIEKTSVVGEGAQ